MNIVDVLTTVIVVTIAVILALSIVMHIGGRQRRAPRAAADDARSNGSWYFVRYSPAKRSDDEL